MNSETLETELGSFRFDTGPSLLLLPEVYKKTMKSLGIDDNEVDMLPVEPFYRVYFEGEEESPVDLSSKEGAIEEMLTEYIDIGSHTVAPAFRRYKRIAERFLDFGLTFVIEEQVRILGLPVLSCLSLSSSFSLLL